MTGAPPEPIHFHADDHELDDLDDLPPPSYEAARAAGAAPPPRPGQPPLPPATTTTPTATIATTQPESSIHHPSEATPNGLSYSPEPEIVVGGESATAHGATDGNAIALQPLPHPPMSTNGPAQAQTQTTSNTTTNPNNRNIKVVPLHLMDEKSEWVECQFCKQKVKTRVVKKGKFFQCLTGTVFCIVCVCLTPLPCCLHWFEQAQWFCSSCEKQIAVRVRDAEIKVFPAPEGAQASTNEAAADRTQRNVVSAAGQRQNGQHTPIVTPPPQQQQWPPPITTYSRHSPDAITPPQVQHDHISHASPQEQPFAASQIQTEEELTPTPAPTASGQAPLQRHHQQQAASSASEGERPPGAMPIKF